MNILRFSVLVALAALGRPAAAQQAEVTVPDRTYELSVVTANGDEFNDCASFGSDHSLVLLAGRGLAIAWLPETGASSARNFDAVTNGNPRAASPSGLATSPLGLALHGTFVDGNAIRGDAINEYGLTFKFTGRLTRGCGGTAIYYPESSPYAAEPTTPVLFEPERGSLAAKLYVVQLYGGVTQEDCLHFVIDGTLSRNGGANMKWGMNNLNSGMGTFQAVGPNASAAAGRALRGELTSLGELRVHGIENDAAGLREIAGSGRETGNCINN